MRTLVHQDEYEICLESIPNDRRVQAAIRGLQGIIATMEIRRTAETARGSIASRPGGGRLAHRIDERKQDVLKTFKWQWHDHSSSVIQLIKAFERSCELAAHDPTVVPLSQELFSTGRTFLRDLPAAYPAPSISVLDTGEISFDWHRDDGGNISAVLLDADTIIYSSLWDDHDEGGVLDFGDEVPEKIVAELRELF